MRSQSPTGQHLRLVLAADTDLDLACIDISWSSLPTEWLLAELANRDDAADAKPECGSGKKGSYDTFMHVAALILILALSTICTHPSKSFFPRYRTDLWACR